MQETIITSYHAKSFACWEVLVYANLWQLWMNGREIAAFIKIADSHQTEQATDVPSFHNSCILSGCHCCDITHCQCAFSEMKMNINKQWCRQRYYCNTHLKVLRKEWGWACIPDYYNNAVKDIVRVLDVAEWTIDQHF